MFKIVAVFLLMGAADPISVEVNVDGAYETPRACEDAKADFLERWLAANADKPWQVDLIECREERGA